MTNNTTAEAPKLITCEAPTCSHTFFHVSARRWPFLCLDHADEMSRLVDAEVR